MITIILPEWFAYLIVVFMGVTVIFMGVTVIKDGLDVYLWYLKRKLDKINND
jgi:hypothetical protein